LISTAAIEELLFLGRKATMMNDNPRRVIEYMMQSVKIKIKSIFLNI
jgi:hypothetical protein